MSTIKANDRVKVVVGTRYYDILGNQIGQVLRTYADISDGVAIVEFPEGMTVKIAFDELVKFEPKREETEEAKRDIPEGAKLITKEDFDKAIMEATLSAKDPRRLLGSLSGTVVGHNIGRKIFESEDAVYMTKDQFIATLWDGCSPANIGESIGNQMSGEKCVHISITAMIGLEQTIEILFGESEELK